MIEAKRLRLRPFTDRDLGALLSYRRDPEIARYQGWSADFSEADGRRFLEAVSTTRLGFRPAGFHQTGAWFKGELCDELLFERASASDGLTAS